MEFQNHHAYFAEVEPALEIDLNLFTIRRWDLESLTIEVSRNINTEANLKPEGGKEAKIFFIKFAGLSREAGESLLKILEDPPRATTFFLITKDWQRLPETLRSRLMKWEVEVKGDKLKVGSGGVEKFLKASPEERLSLWPKLAENQADTINQLEMEIEKSFVGEDKRVALELIIEARKLSREPSMVARLLWDHLALTLPELKK